MGGRKNSAPKAPRATGRRDASPPWLRSQRRSAFPAILGSLEPAKGDPASPVFSAGAAANGPYFFGAAAVELIESSVAMVAAGRELLPEGVWRRGSLGESAIPAADLVIANYALGELREGDRERVVERAWKAARVLVVVEAGSSAGFAVVRGIRDRLLGEGARMIAPCPGEASCPVAEGDWCHFGARLERSALHRQAKQGTLSYEDEKYSYVVLAKGEGARAAGRVIRRPVHQPGLVELMVCDGAKVVREQVRKKDKEKFRAARHAAWGGEWPAGERG